MNILIYNWKDLKNPVVGGAEIITHTYATKLVKDGHTVTWFCRSFPGAKEKEIVDGVTIIRRGNILSTYFMGWQYYRSLEHKPDLVIDMLNTIAWQTPLYAAKQSKTVQYVNQLAKEVFDYNLRPPLSWIGKFVESFQLIPYHHRPVVTYAQSTKDDLAAWGYDKRKIFLFRLGLDHERYVPGKKADYPLFLQVSRMVGMKRPDLTVKAFAQVVKKHPEARLALVGTGPFKENVDKLIKDLNLTDNVMVPDKDILFFEKVRGDQKVKLMQEAWCFVHPSVKEGWGMVITEAAACGTPSIATSVTGQVDAIKNNNTGILISASPTVDELASAMLKIIEDKPLRLMLSKNAIQWAKEFDWDASYNQFKEAIGRATGLKI